MATFQGANVYVPTPKMEKRGFAPINNASPPVKPPPVFAKVGPCSRRVLTNVQCVLTNLALWNNHQSVGAFPPIGNV